MKRIIIIISVCLSANTFADQNLDINLPITPRESAKPTSIKDTIKHWLGRESKEGEKNVPSKHQILDSNTTPTMPLTIPPLPDKKIDDILSTQPDKAQNRAPDRAQELKEQSISAQNPPSQNSSEQTLPVQQLPAQEIKKQDLQMPDLPQPVLPIQELGPAALITPVSNQASPQRVNNQPKIADKNLFIQVAPAPSRKQDGITAAQHNVDQASTKKQLVLPLPTKMLPKDAVVEQANEQLSAPKDKPLKTVLLKAIGKNNNDALPPAVSPPKMQTEMAYPSMQKVKPILKNTIEDKVPASKVPPAHPPISSASSSFIEREAAILTTLNDEVILGQLTMQAHLDDMPYKEYIHFISKQLATKDSNEDLSISAAMFKQRKVGKVNSYIDPWPQALLSESIMKAIKHRDLEKVQVLIYQFPHLLEYKDQENNDLLQLAAKNNANDIASWLVASGHALNNQNNSGETACSIAMKQQNAFLSSLLSLASKNTICACTSRTL